MVEVLGMTVLVVTGLVLMWRGLLMLYRGYAADAMVRSCW